MSAVGLAPLDLKIAPFGVMTSTLYNGLGRLMGP